MDTHSTYQTKYPGPRGARSFLGTTWSNGACVGGVVAAGLVKIGGGDLGIVERERDDLGSDPGRAPDEPRARAFLAGGSDPGLFSIGFACASLAGVVSCLRFFLLQNAIVVLRFRCRVRLGNRGRVR